MTPREINFQETPRSIIGNPFCALESVNKFAARNESRICLHFIESDTSQTSDSERSRKLNKFIELAARHMFPYVNLIRKKGGRDYEGYHHHFPFLAQLTAHEGLVKTF
jgi:hypothetical protein